MSDWTDDDGIPLGQWEEIARDEWRQIMQDAGGYDALTVFSTLTDPEGNYGPPRIYTAWGRPGENVPLTDIADIGMDGFGTPPERQVFRKFVRRPPELEEPGRVS